MPLKFVKSQKGKQLLMSKYSKYMHLFYIIKRLLVSLSVVESIIKNINAVHALHQQ